MARFALQVAAGDLVIRSLDFDQPVDAAVECDDEIDFPALFVAQVEQIPVLPVRVFAEMYVLQQAASSEVFNLGAESLIVCGGTILKSHLL